MHSDALKDRNKISPTSFTRERKLTFSKMMLLMTRKSVKSLQNMLNETEIYLSQALDKDLKTVSNSAFSQARKNLNYTAFVELCNGVRDKFYEDDDYQTFKGFRLLGVDGSIITLPNNDETRKEFGSTNVINQYKDKSKKIVQARASLLYDVLNSVVVDAVLTDTKTHEIKIAKNQHLKHVKENDLIIFDRGYPSYEMFASITHTCKADYLIRIKKITYKKYTAPLFDKDNDINDIIVSLTPATKAVSTICKEEKLPETIQVRFVKVILDNGDIEVLATSVLDKEKLQTSDFKELYFQRWKIETCYEIIKNRLALENFTGESVLAIKQDFYATMFISNIEAAVIFDLNIELQEDRYRKKQKQQRKVNKSVSFNTIKNYAFELFYFEGDVGEIIEKIYKLLKTNTVAIRPNRHYERPSAQESKHTKNTKSANFQKRKKKVVF
jgi:hypothetical protein